MMANVELLQPLHSSALVAFFERLGRFQKYRLPSRKVLAVSKIGRLTDSD